MSRASIDFWCKSQLWFQNCFFNWPTVKTQLRIYKNKNYTYRKKWFFLKLFLKVVLSEFVNMSQQGSIKIFLKTFYERFLEKKHKNINDNRHILVHILFIYWFCSLVWCRMLAVLSWTPIPTVSINVCSPHPPPCIMLHCPFDWLGVQWERREDAWLKKC